MGGLLFFLRGIASMRRGKNSEKLGIYRLGCWERDYFSLLKEFVPEGRITVSKIPPEVWPERGWIESGAIIEVDLGE